MKHLHYSKIYNSNIPKNILMGPSLFVLIAAMSISIPAAAQDTQLDEEDEVIATGIRQSLQNAQDIKRNADTFVDSITASDIGALPDRSVLEALQRVPGVSISRFAGGDDPDHFSVEGSGVVIRGLDFVRSEFNGRDTFSANNGRALGFQDVPPELVGGVDVFKNQTADMVEGGISGVVNLRTLKPFDRSERTIAATVDATYSDYRDEVSPSISGLFADRWDTKNGEFGLLASGAFSNLKSRSSGFRVAPLYPYAQNDDGSIGGGGPIDATNNIAAPAGLSLQDQQFDRDRVGLSLVGQWASNDGRHEATAEFIRSESDLAWTERTVQLDDNTGNLANYRSTGPVTTTSFDSAGILQTRNDLNRIPIGGGLFESGTLTSSAVGWTGRQGQQYRNFTRQSDTNAITSDYSFNYKFTPNDNWKLNFDAQYVDSTTVNSDISVFTGNFFDTVIGDVYGDNPTVQHVRNANDQQFGFAGNEEGSFSDLAIDDPRTQYWLAAMDHFEDSEGDELALRADVEHEFNSDGWFKSIRVGGRYSERDQTTRWAEYNWQNLSEAWNGGYRSFAQTPDSSLYETFSFSDFRNPATVGGNASYIFPSVGLVQDYERLLGFASSDYLQSSAFNGAAGRTQTNSSATNGAALEAGSPQNGRFYDSEISRVKENNLALYARVDFSNEDFANGITVDGNYGLRVVSYETSADGALAYQPLNGEALQLLNGTYLSELDPSVRAALTADQVATIQGFEDIPLFNFFNGSPPIERSIGDETTYVLPSFNVKFGLTDDLLLRFAAAKALSYPDIGSLRAYRQYQSGIETGGTLTIAPAGGGDPENIPQTISFTSQLQGGNPNLKPIQSLNLDASLEYYFNDVGSFTASLFYKDLDDVVINGLSTGEIGTLSDGRTINFEYAGPVNGADGKVKGFELAYQQFYDFLPGWMSGLGLQANYTYVDQDAIPNGGTRSVGAVQRDEARFNPTDLENLSKHTVNLVGLYENDKVEARIAYNWRSDFLLTTTDVITRLPVYNESTGQVDASLKYQVNDMFQIGLQGVNLLSEVTETTIQIDDAGQRVRRALFENDRRISLVGSFTF